MKFKELEFKLINNYDFYNYEVKLIKSVADLDDLGIVLKDKSLLEIIFKESFLVSVVYFDGSNPKRFIKSLNYDNNTKILEIITNKEDITFSTMDYRMHDYLLQIDKIEISELVLKN